VIRRTACTVSTAVALACLAGCHARQHLHDAQLMAECEGRTCVTVEQSGDPHAAFDVEAEYRSTMHDVYTQCRVTMRRPTASPTPGMKYTPLVEQGEVFPMDGAIAKVQRCYTEHDVRYGDDRARLVYLVSPPGYESLAPGAGNVIVPFEEDQLALAGGLSGRADRERDGRDFLVSDRVTLIIDSPETGEDVHNGLRVGDTFRWGAREARVVRIVTPHPWVIGWVEVAFR
jgi:hypothetical protein